MPHSIGGQDIPSNYVLLCKRCHQEAPNVSDPEFMWEWIRAHLAPILALDSYWILRGFREFEFVFGRKPFDDLNREVGSEELKSLLKPLFKKVSWHFGQGRLNASTIAWCLREVERELAKQEKLNKAPSTALSVTTPATAGVAPASALGIT